MVERKNPRATGAAAKPKRHPKVAGRATARPGVAEPVGTEASDASAAPTEVRPAPSYSKIAQRRAERAQAEAGPPVIPAPRKRRPAAAPESVPLVKQLRSSFIILGVALVLAIIGGVLVWSPWSSEQTKNTAFFTQDSGSKLREQMAPALCAPFTYSYQDIDGWVAKASERLTGEPKAMMQTYLDTAKGQIEEGKIDSMCEVYENTFAIADFRGDSAKINTILEINQLVSGIPVQSYRPRIQFSLVREGGVWKVNEVLDLDCLANRVADDPCTGGMS